MIGYDFDGVIVGDIIIEENHLEQIIMARNRLLLPFFIPNGDYAIITARPKIDKAYTLIWIEKHLVKNLPTKVFHDNENRKKPAEYKCEVINREGISKFFESDIKQYSYLKKACPKCSILYFRNVINKGINECLKL
jgi:hypothetical protein